MAEGFKMGAAFVDVTTKDSTDEGRSKIGSTMAKWAGGLALGGIISKGISDNLDIGAANAKLGAQLNLTKDVADRMGKISGQVYTDNFGESIPEINDAIASVGNSLVNLNTASADQIKGITEKALGLSSTFNVDVNESIRAASALISNKLAPDSTAAFDQMTRAFQMGGNEAGDLLETITEYAPQFNKLGLDGPIALGLLSQGLKAGARDTDVIADAFKEFSLRAIDGSKLTGEGFKALGLDGEAMGKKIAAGGDSAKAGLLETLTALQNIKDPVAQNTAGVALFGTQWEDTLRQILPSMDLTEAALTDVTGATDKMNKAASDSAANGLESVKRKMDMWVQSITNANGPLGDLSSWAIGVGGWAIPMVANIGMIISGFSALNIASVGAALSVVGSWIAMAAAATANAIVMAASWLIAFWPIALIVAAVIALVALVIMNWDTIKTWTVDTWNAIWKFISDVITWIVDKVRTGVQWVIDAWNWLSSLPGKFRDWLVGIVVAANQKLGELVEWFRGLPGRILGALGDLGNLLLGIGKKIIDGFLRGLKAAWKGVTDFVSGIGSWISDHKGPIEVDAVLLTPHGNAIMDGLAAGLQAQFDARVKPTVEGMAGDLASTTFPIPAIGSTPGSPTGPTPAAGSDGSAAPVHIENLTVTFPGSLNAMSRTELRAAAEFLGEELRQINRGRAVVA